MKKRTRLGNVCRSLVDSLTSHKKITEDQILTFMEELATEEPKALADMPSDYRKLSFSMGEAWQYREWETMSPKQAFFYGSLWGSSKSFELRYRKKLDADQMKLLVPKYKNKEWIFRAIKAQPGILHKELADKGDISPSRLSQIMDDKDIDTLISYRLSGREKYYFLKPDGEELLSRFKTAEKRVLGSYTEPYKAISINNDSTKWLYNEVTLFILNYSEILFIARTLRGGLWGKGFDRFSDELGTKSILEVNEWTQGLNYKAILEENRLKTGLEMSLAR
ncbi:MAG: hypothetical protein NC416_00240 [Eubacterium sp.]|nr:hypothetical protein [Eubacterium sp.]